MVALPGTTPISFTNDRMKARVSVNLLSIRNSRISFTCPAMAFSSPNPRIRTARMALASSAATSSFSCRSLCSRMRGRMSLISRSVVSTACHSRSSLRRISFSSSSMASTFSRCSLITLSNSSLTSFTRSRMLLSAKMFSRICSIIIRSNRLELSRGVSQAPCPCLSSEWQT